MIRFSSKLVIFSVGTVASLLLSSTVHAQVLLSEGFDTMTPSGWTVTNNSSPLGVTNWFQGNDTVFPAQSGATTSYAGANFNNGSGASDLSNWLITPQLTVQNGDTVSFFTRTITTVQFADRLQLRFSPNGASTNVGATATSIGDFTTLLVDVNPTLTTSGYPNTWTQFSVNLSGLSGLTSGRFAFRYFVTNGGPGGANSDYIGVDTFSVSRVAAAAPEPTTLALAGLGVAGLIARRRRK